MPEEVYMDYKIRKLKKDEVRILEIFLYEAIFISEGVEPPPKDIINHPDLNIYISDFGGKTDLCYVAEVSKKIVGAAWTRIINDYGHIDDETPSLSISLLKEFRNQGIGTTMVKQILKKLKEQGYKQVSLSVQKKNYAFNMYKNVGFEIVRENKEDYIMVCRL
jgi:acetyltransferase, GNAT family